MSRIYLNFLEILLFVFLYFLDLCTKSCEPITNIIVGGSHGGFVEDSRLGRSYVMLVRKQFLNFLRMVMASSSGIKRSLTSTYSPSQCNIPKVLNFRFTITLISRNCQISFTTCKILGQLHSTSKIVVHFRAIMIACENKNFKKAKNLL
jgi:hypothetical protein